MKLSSLLTPSLVKINLTAEDKPSVIEELVQFLVDQNSMENMDILLEKVNTREKKMTTGIGAGIAVPHAKSSLVDKMLLVCGISQKGIDFESVDKRPVNLFFLIISPSNVTGPHIQTLANISRITSSEELGQALINAPNAESFLDILTKGEEQI